MTLTPGSSPGLALTLSHQGFFAQPHRRRIHGQIMCAAPLYLPSGFPAFAGMTVVMHSTHQGRGDIEVLPEGVFGVGGVEIPNSVTSKSSWHPDNPAIRRTKDYDQDGSDLSIPVPVRHLMMVSHVVESKSIATGPS